MKFFIYLFLISLPLTLFANAIALNSIKDKDETIMIPGTGLIAGTATTNKYFRLEDKKHLAVVSASQFINKSNKAFHRRMNIALKNIDQKNLEKGDLKRIKLALHRAIDESQDKKALVKIIPLLKHPQLVKNVEYTQHTSRGAKRIVISTGSRSKNIMLNKMATTRKYD